jgi:lactate racemase
VARPVALSSYNESVILRLPYGRGSLIADLRGLHAQVLAPAAPRVSPPLGRLVKEALAAPAGTPSLADLARDKSRIVVLVPDATRKAWLPELLPLLLEPLLAAGAPAAGITVLVACGTHPPAAPAALHDLVGTLPDGIAVIQHDAHDEATLVEVGSLLSGVPLRLNRRAVEADLRIAISTVQHHYFAGFGGGPKLVFPGISGYAETQANHSRVIHLEGGEPRRDPRCEPGVVDGNPIAEEIQAAAALLPVDLALLLVAGGDGKACWAAAGSLDATFPAACAKAREWYETEAGPFARMVLTGGGFPSDDTLIQAHKALDAGCRFLSPGGEVLFAAACEGGAGSPAMEPFLEDPRPASIVRRLGERYVQYGHTTLRLVEKTDRFRVLATTQLPDGLVRRLGMTPVADVQDVLDRWRSDAPGGVVGVVPGGPVYPASTRAGAAAT